MTDDTLRDQLVELLRKYSDRADGYRIAAEKVAEFVERARADERARRTDLVEEYSKREQTQDRLRELLTAERDKARQVAVHHRRRAERAEAVLRDIAEHGLRADLNPTVPNVGDAGNYGWWMNYLQRIDASLRERARAALDGPEATDD